jgi:hypothetical protein
VATVAPDHLPYDLAPREIITRGEVVVFPSVSYRGDESMLLIKGKKKSKRK